MNEFKTELMEIFAHHLMQGDGGEDALDMITAIFEVVDCMVGSCLKTALLNSENKTSLKKQMEENTESLCKSLAMELHKHIHTPPKELFN